MESDAYRVLFRWAADGMVLIDAATGIIEDCNREFERQTGRTLDVLKGVKIWELRPAEKISAAREMFFRIVETGEGGSGELELERPDGTPVPVEFRSRVIKKDGKRYVYSICRDITERRRTEEKLRESEERLRSIIEAEPECVKIVAPDGALIEMNPAGLGMIEAESLDEVKGRVVYDLVAPEYRNAFITLTEKVCGGSHGILEFEMIGLKGRRRWLETHAVPLRDSRGNINSMLAVTRDITERKNAENALRESEEKFRSIAEHSMVGIYLIQSGKIMYGNSRLAEIFGIDIDEIVGHRSLEDFILPEDVPVVRENIRKRLAGEEDSIHYEFRGLHRDGRVLHLEVFGTRIRYRGEPAIIGTLLDVTERKTAEEEREKKSEELAAINRIIIKTQGTLDSDEFMGVTLDAVCDLLMPDMALFYIARDGRLFLEDWRPTEERNVVHEKEFGECLCGIAARGREVVYSSDIHADIRCTLDECKRAGMHSFVALPFRRGGELLGLLGLGWKKQREFEDKRDFFETLAGSLSIAIHNTMLYREVKKYAEELEVKIEERTEELQKIVNLMAGREVRMAELKKVIGQLREQIEMAGLTPVADDPLREEGARAEWEPPHP